MKYISTKQASLKWGITERRIRVLCAEGKVNGAFSLGKTWNIPSDAEKPVDGRVQKKKTVVVFGGAGPVGSACAERFLSMHCNVVSIDKKAHPNENITSLIVKNTQASIAEACNEIPDVNLLILYPTIYSNSQITKSTKQELDSIVDLNVKSCFYVAQALIKKLRKSNGQIIVLSSSAGEKPEPMSPIYCMSHASLIMLAKCLAVSEGKHKVRVNTVLMGPATDSETFTNLINENQIKNWKKTNPLKSMCEIKDFVDMVVMLSGFAGNKVENITGAQIAVDCGETITSALINQEE